MLVRTGEVVDILLDVTNPGRWMAHCHIAEHHESGMMFSFDVAPAEDGAGMTEQRDVVVIGGGQAGLAVGYYLARQERRFTILEAAGEPAAAWRARWDSLRLFTPVRRDSLPGRAFPGDPDSYPDRDEVVAYLEDYARHFELPVELDSRVLAVRGADDGFEVELADRRYLAEQVVVATGPFQVPFIPPIASGLAPEVTQTAQHRATAGRRSCPMVRWSSSAAATPATRSPRSSCARARCTWPSAPARRRCRSASWAATCSATWSGWA